MVLEFPGAKNQPEIEDLMCVEDIRRFLFSDEPSVWARDNVRMAWPLFVSSLEFLQKKKNMYYGFYQDAQARELEWATQIAGLTEENQELRVRNLELETTILEMKLQLAKRPILSALGD